MIKQHMNQRANKKYLETNENKSIMIQAYGTWQKQF